ncbi:hypothetical protein ACRYGV_18085 [Mycobacteroides abscessus]
MTETPDLTLRQWFGKLIRGQHHLAIGGEDDPYLLRWYLIPRNKRLNIYLHQFIRSDDDRALHDHPWWFWSFVLAGHYYEHRADGRRIKRHWASIAYRAAKTRHRVELPKSNDPMSLLEREDCCWTIVVTGPEPATGGSGAPEADSSSPNRVKPAPSTSTDSYRTPLGAPPDAANHSPEHSTPVMDSGIGCSDHDHHSGSSAARCG